ncbi:hypothetical protein PVL29_013162 [Vitis rotundifolia]|uniref:Fe2OG dioxygenase domain-containing protein n=1 Tax=Vitis rotundifolia TaxID=103349 RepID=A0AA38ZM53_VITRO|nr:hypothetical protein PVL29_013162 [Vitis rotundifolia]
MDAQKLTSLGGSLPVPCVQELAKKTLTTVPPRYLRPEQDPPFLSDSSTTCSSIHAPVIDFNCLVSGDSMDSELDKLHYACKEWGFFQLTNHGVISTLVEKVKVEKKKFWQQPEDIEGFGQAFVVSEEQKLDWADMFYMIILPTHLRKPHLFPKLSVSLRETLEVYTVELRNLAMTILGFLAKALKMEASDMKELFEEGHQGMRMNYYPPCPQPDQVLGLTPHSDPVGPTILLQVNEMEGLQIRKDGMWVPIKPLPGAFIVNIGDILEIVTNGTCRSIEHRATVNSIKERLSIATIYSPKLNGDMGPAPSLVSPDSPALFKRIGVSDYFKGLFSRELDGKSYLEVLRSETGEAQNN